MADFLSFELNPAPITATRVVEAANFDREVVASANGVRIGFTSAQADGGAFFSSAVPVSFVLPSHEELWVKGTGSSIQAEFLVSKPRCA